MNELIQSIEAGLHNDATEAQRSDAIAACQAILTALGSKPGAPLVPAVATVDPSMALDLIIGKLKAMVADKNDAGLPAPVRGYRVELVPISTTARPDSGR